MKKGGFTLIELMVVISIIALISSVVLVSLKAAREKARNTSHIQNLVQLRNAIEEYANKNNGKYPLPAGVFNINGLYLGNRPSLPPYNNENNGTYYTPDWIPGLVSGGYIKQLPQFIDTYGTPPPAGCANLRPTYYYRSNAGYGYKLFILCPEGGIINTGEAFKNPNPAYAASSYSVCADNKNDGGAGDSAACATY